MAVHRRPLVDGPPLELVVFRPDDWLPAIGDVSPYEAWLKARSYVQACGVRVGRR
jgi:hypothetical protein